MITDINQLPADSESAFVCADCMDVMRRFPDGYFDLSIVDPPYGINMGHTCGIGRGGYERPFGGGGYSPNISIWGQHKSISKAKFYHPFDDSAAPDGEYFAELMRVSKAQIIWGGNFFLDYLGKASCMIVWDKGRRGMDQADCEIAWTSLPGQSRIYEFKWNGMLQGDMKNKEHRIHPTQKPVALYRWLIDRFTKPTDIILDTHVGSASSLIACHRKRHNFVGFELDEHYYKLSKERLEREMAQMTMFDFME